MKGQLLFQGMRVAESSVLTLKNESHSVTAQVTIPRSGAEGVIIEQGGPVGGWSLYALDGHLEYRFKGTQSYVVTSDRTLPPGEHQVRMELEYDDDDDVAKGGRVTLFLDGKPIGKGRVGRSGPVGESADQVRDLVADVVAELGPDQEAAGSDWHGTIAWVQLDLGQ
jgi:arylsulfatase